MLIAIDTQSIAEILASYVNGRRECEADGDAENAKVWKDRFDNAAYFFLCRLGIDAYYDEDLGAIKVETEDVHLLG